MRLKVAPVAKVPVEVQATDLLRASIVTGALAPGARITETAIAEQMRVSRATVRTALHQLFSEGLVSQVPYTGWAVITLRAEDIRELFSVRSALERLAARTVAENLTPAQARNLQSAFDALKQAAARGNAEQTAEADFALHKTLIRLADNTRLIRQYTILEQQIRILIRGSDALTKDQERVAEQHLPIVQAILDKDIEAAGRLLEEHIISDGNALYIHMMDN